VTAGAFRRVESGYVLMLAADERALLSRLLDELRTLLVQPDDGAGPALQRLFPVVHPDAPELEEEYQRLMREELVASRLAGINAVDEVLRGGDSSSPGVTFDEERLLSFMQAVNGVRLVLGTLLGVTDDGPDGNPADDGIDDDTGALAPERQLYGFLSWLLDSAVVALSPGTIF
jgi:hypothetical protein